VNIALLSLQSRNPSARAAHLLPRGEDLLGCPD
jgi:hypothetical protein